jgi:tetratricopeptide (TPR) repeat protein
VTAPVVAAVDAAKPAAPAPAPPAPTPEPDPARHAQALARGRELDRAGDHAGALAAFRDAVAAMPGDPVALSELSWAAFQTGDLELARDAGEKSVAGAHEPKLKAASLYNLGRISEERGEAARAQALYRESLALRPNRAVRQRLLRLGKPDQLVAVPLGGARDAVCPAEGEPDFDGEPCDWSPVAATLPAPFVALGLATRGFPEIYHAYVVKTSAGTFQSTPVHAHGSRQAASFDGLELGPTPLGARLAFRYRYRWAADGERYPDGDQPAGPMLASVHQVVCGGAADDPRCVDLEIGDGGGELAVRIESDRLTLGAGTGRPGKGIRDRIGTYALSFR